MSTPTIPSSWAFTKLGRVTGYSRVNKAEPDDIEEIGNAAESTHLNKNLIPPFEKGGLGGINKALADDEAQP